MQRIGQLIERVLWSTRLLVIVAVAACIVAALGMLYMATVDMIYVLTQLVQYTDRALSSGGRSELRAGVIIGVAKALDSYLIAAILLLVGFGLYELFVNKLDTASNSYSAPRLLQVRSFDHLKDRVAKMILLVLIVEFFQYALRLQYAGALDLLYLALSILLIGATLYLTREKQPAAETLSPPSGGNIPLPKVGRLRVSSSTANDGRATQQKRSTNVD